MSLLSKKMIELTENETKYHSLNGKSILNFPLSVPVGISIDTFLKDAFAKYRKLLCDEMIDLDNSISEKDKNKACEDVSVVSSNIIDALDSYKKGKIKSAYNSIGYAMKKGVLKEIELDKDQNTTYYRMRSGLGHHENIDFYHIPFDKLYLTDSYRFSMPGFPCLYIGYTENVCKREIRKDGSIIQLNLKNLKNCNNTPLKLIDLTWFQSDKKDIIDFLVSWPLIAACYLLPNYCKSFEKVCDEINQKFKEQYIIPQLISAYIREEYKNVNGIRYYSTRYENLDPQNTDYMNIALFANYDRKRLEEDKRIYDENITSDRFVFSNPHDVFI